MFHSRRIKDLEGVVEELMQTVDYLCEEVDALFDKVHAPKNGSGFVELSTLKPVSPAKKPAKRKYVKSGKYAKVTTKKK